MNQRNYQKELDRLLDSIPRGEKSLMLHSCCAPCSSYVLEYLSQYFRITVFYYNPNIAPKEEYQKRVAEQKRLIDAYNKKGDKYPIQIIDGDYEPELFYAMAQGKENIPEGGERCFGCFALRLQKTAEKARECKADYFATTLTISPLKNAQKINEIGESIAKNMECNWLPSDFKKRNGYLRSIELSKEYDLYRQDFCGCEFSEREKIEREKNLLH